MGYRGIRPCCPRFSKFAKQNKSLLEVSDFIDETVAPAFKAYNTDDEFDSAVEKQINNWVKLDNWGMGLIDDHGNIVTQDVVDIDESLNEHQGRIATQATLLGVIQRQQAQINKLDEAMVVIFKRNSDLEKDLNRVTWALRKSADALNDIKIGGK